MSAVTFDVTFETQDILRIPQIRKALRQREDSYLDNINWLDEDLENKMEKRHQENINWLDQDLNEKMEQRHQENIAWLDQDLANKIDEEAAVTIQKHARRMNVMNTIASASEPGGINGLLTMGPSGNLRIPKIWHCGHGVGEYTGTPEQKKARRKRIRKQYEDGLVDGTCLIGHRHQQENERGNNTRKQFMEFQREAKEGDIIFNHCSRLGGITHYGFYTGKITKRPSPAPEDAGQGWYHSFISVYLWIPLPEVVKGVGRNSTLYEVTPKDKKGNDTKNFQNYIRAALGITSS